MNRGYHRRHECVHRPHLAIALLTLLAYSSPFGGSSSTSIKVNNKGLHGAVAITAPANFSTIGGLVTVATAVVPAVSWIDFYLDGYYLASSPPFLVHWNSTAVSNGAHQLSVTAFDDYGRKLGSASANVMVENNGSTMPATIPGLTGSASDIPGADSNPGDYGNYTARGGSGAGYELIGGPLLNDAQAASMVVKTQLSNIELGPDAPTNAAANNYFTPSPPPIRADT